MVEPFAAFYGDAVAGTYILKPNQGGPGDHVANAALMVSGSVWGRGVSEAMGLDALDRAVQAGYKAMQFSFVVSTDKGTVRIWEKLGFEIVGTLPQAFRHPSEGCVDAFVMFKRLREGDQGLVSTASR